ncbi:hypothetical protein [Solimonas marina]|uniref:Uncharacterized protein n=1 Tax=Solimonas marina TaxID=2714601 RepID=A0A969WBK4_9GAMM|nr:hypothetical protein [Solimonas marina]NKF23013.1 hypothetical protein [Solimonas marina]
MELLHRALWIEREAGGAEAEAEQEQCQSGTGGQPRRAHGEAALEGRAAKHDRAISEGEQQGASIALIGAHRQVLALPGTLITSIGGIDISIVVDTSIYFNNH